MTICAPVRLFSLSHIICEQLQYQVKLSLKKLKNNTIMWSNFSSFLEAILKMSSIAYKYCNYLWTGVQTDICHFEPPFTLIFAYDFYMTCGIFGVIHKYSCGSCEVSLKNTTQIYSQQERLDIHYSCDYMLI